MRIYYNNTFIEIQPNDEAYRSRQIMGEDALTLTFEYQGYLDIPVGAYCVFGDTTYYLLKPENFKKDGERKYSYELYMESDAGRLKLYRLKNTVDGRLKFEMNSKPEEYLQMIVDNMNLRDSGWTVGNCVISDEKMISFNHNRLSEALDTIAKTFDTEWSINGKTINLGKVRANYDSPIELSYGKGNGFVPGLGRANADDSSAFEILYVQGGERNIDYSTYGNKTLLLPKSKTISFDGKFFENEEGFNIANSRQYITDATGTSIRRNDRALSALAPEDSFDNSEAYPKRVGTVSEWICVDAEKHLYDFKDSSIPQILDYNQYMIEGETMTVIFQSGMLAGREFEINEKGYDHATRRFQIVPADMDGQAMPSEVFKAEVGDKYAIFGCTLPDAYICDNATKTGSSWDLFKEAVRYMYENEDARFTFDGILDGHWVASRWSTIGPKIVLGGTVLFSDTQFLQDGEKIRIVGIKDYLNKPKYPELSLSNATVTSSIVTELNEYKAEEVVREKRIGDSVQFTKRRWRDLKETSEMLEAAIDNYSSAINPISVQTMQLIVGDESLQFRFVTSKTAPAVDTRFGISYDVSTKILTLTGGLIDGSSILQHMTIGVNALSSEHTAAEYHFWDIPQFQSVALSDTNKKYYVYAKCSKTATTGEFLLSEQAIKMEQEDGYYHFLVGILNSEYEGNRSFVSMYGYTEILPGRMTVGNVMSKDGRCWFDLDTGHFHIKNADGGEYVTLDDNGVQISGRVTIGNGSTGVSNFGDFGNEVTKKIKAIDLGVQNLLRNSGFTGDYLSEELADQIVLEETKAMYNSPLVHWESNGANGVADVSYLSGHACEISAGGFISQTLEVVLRAGNAYSIKFSSTGSGTLVIGTLSVQFENSFETTFIPNEEVSVLKITATGSLTIGDIMLVPGEISVEWSRSPLDNQADRVYYQSLKYLADAMGRGDTVINGGLILSNIIALGNYDGSGTINSGISGIKNVDSDVAFWGGGTYDQAQATALKFIAKPSSEVASDDAKAVITHGGTAVLNDVIVHGKVYASEGEFSGTVTSTKGNIGGFEIGDGWLQSKELGPDGLSLLMGLKLSSTTLSFPGRNTTDGAYFNSLTISSTGGASSGMTYKMYDARIEYSGKSNEQVSTGISIDVTGGTSTNKAISVSASGNADATKNVALELLKGCVAGFRPKTVFPSISPYDCDSLDNVVIMTSGTVILPSPVEHGHMLLIWHISDSRKLTILSREEIIVTMDGRSGTSIDSTNQECILLTYAYDGEYYRWYLAYFG